MPVHQRIYQVGVIGAGARGESFARQLYEGHPRATLFGVCDIDGDRLAKFCQYCGLEDARQFTDQGEFLSHSDLDAVIITTPEFTHADVAIAAMQAGKHIYLEKAMAQNTAECRRIIKAHRQSNVTVYLGFNMREIDVFGKLKEIIDSRALGALVHVSGVEQLEFAHGASFMRRYHRHSSRSGGLLNTKCSHDLDCLQWLVGHQHKVRRIASFGGVNVFHPDKQLATHCSQCAIEDECSYRDRAGFVFPIFADKPMHHGERALYGGDLCVYNAEKDLVDNQSVLLEWENGVRGTFNLQMFQGVGLRRYCVWGEKGYAELNLWPKASLQVIESATGHITNYEFAPAKGGHGGSDPRMIHRFIAAIEGKENNGSGLAAGLAATLLAEKADIARLSGNVVEISPTEYD